MQGSGHRYRTGSCWCRDLVAGAGLVQRRGRRCRTGNCGCGEESPVQEGDCCCMKALLAQEGSCLCRKVVAGAGLVIAGAVSEGVRLDFQN